MMSAMARNLDIDLVRTFITVADLAVMTAAANALHKTQGAVSQQIIKRLEEALGARLFERGPRNVRLTRAGEILLPKARRLLALNDGIWADMRGEAIRGRVRVGVPYDLVGTFMAPVLKAFAAAHAEVEVSLDCRSSPDLLAALLSGEADLVLAEQPAAQHSGECLRVERLVWVGARGGDAHLRTPLAVSMVAETCAFRGVVLAALERQDRAWRTLFESGNIEATTATVRADLAITAWLACTVPPGLDVLGPATGLPELPPFAITLHTPKGTMSPAAAAMAGHIRAGVMQPALAA
jgi:DNA-binding transcriptional LysR family regulator